MILTDAGFGDVKERNPLPVSTVNSVGDVLAVLEMPSLRTGVLLHTSIDSDLVNIIEMIKLVPSKEGQVGLSQNGRVVGHPRLVELGSGLPGDQVVGLVWRAVRRVEE